MNAAPPTTFAATMRAMVLGLIAGLGLLLPVLVWVIAEPGTARTVAMLIAAVLAIALVRRCGKTLLAMVADTAQSWRPLMLLVYGLSAMLPLVVLLLAPPRWGH